MGDTGGYKPDPFCKILEPRNERWYMEAT